VYLDLDLTNWLEWGSEPSSKGEDRLKVHPLVSAFVSTMGDKVFYSNYNSEEPPKYAIDPRGWEQISDIIYDNDGVIAKELIENKVGKEIAASFIAFAKTTQITIEDVLEGNYEAHEIPTTFDAKYALALSLKSASDEEISVVREFVKKELGSEITAMFDSVWIGEDNERAILIDNLIKNGNLKSQKNQNLNSHENENSNGQKSSYKITVDEFWKLKDKTGIYCNNMEQAKILCEVFDKMGKKWSNKISYKDKNEFEKIIKYYGSGVIFFNNGLYSDTKFAQFAQEYNMTIYDFSEVDLSKYTNTKNIYKTTIEESFKER